MAARSLRSYGRHSRKSSYSFVTIRKLLTRCGARMLLTGAEYRELRLAGHCSLVPRASWPPVTPKASRPSGSPRPREASQTTAEGTTVQKIGATSIAEVGKMIGELRAAKDFLESEGERVQREAEHYTTLTQMASASVKIISDPVAG
jgi:hypothetical protein